MERDIHTYGTRINAVLRRIENNNLNESNRDDLLEFYEFLVANGLSRGRILKYLYHLLKIEGWLDKPFKEAEATITVVVNENLNCKKQDFLGDVIFYNNKIQLMDIVRILREMEEKQIEKELNELGEINISQDVVSVQDMAKELHVSPKTLTEIEIPNYIVIGEQIVSKMFLEKVKREIRPFQEYPKVEEILDNRNLTTLALEYMGYKIVWEGLYPTKVVEKKAEMKPV